MDGVDAHPAVPGQTALILADTATRDLLVDRDELLGAAVVGRPSGRGSASVQW